MTAKSGPGGQIKTVSFAGEATDACATALAFLSQAVFFYHRADLTDSSIPMRIRCAN